MKRHTSLPESGPINVVRTFKGLTEPITKQQLSNETGYSVHYLAKILANLKRHSFIKEIKGVYTLSEKGKRTSAQAIVFAIQEEPSLTPSEFDFNDLSAIDWQIINNSEQFANNEVAARRLRPLAIAYLFAIGKPPRVNIGECPDITDEDNLIFEGIQAFLKVINEP
jgi:DNA-binding PadR family transcriptional regulator